MSTGSPTSNEAGQNASPQPLPSLSAREVQRQNHAFAQMRQRAKGQLSRFNTLSSEFSQAIDQDTGSVPAPAAAPVPQPTVTHSPLNDADPNDLELYRRGSVDAGAVSNLSGQLRALASEHQLNQDEQWFNSIGRERYVELREYLSIQLGDLLNASIWSGMGPSRDLSQEIGNLNALVQSTIHTNGDIPGDNGLIDPPGAFRKLDDLCNRLDALVASMRAEVRSAYGRIHAAPASMPPAPAAAPVAGPVPDPVDSDTDYVSGATGVEYARIAAALQGALAGVTTEEFWRNPLLQVDSVNVSTLARNLQSHTFRIRPVRGQPAGTYDAQEVNDLYTELQELTLAMQNQITAHQNRPDAYRVDLEAEENRYLTGLRTRFRQSMSWLFMTRTVRYTAGVAALASMVTLGIWNLNKGEEGTEEQANSAAAVSTNTGLPPPSQQQLTTGGTLQTGNQAPPAQVNVAPTVFDLGHSSNVHRESDTLVVTLPTERHFQFWVGIKGQKPEKFTPVAGTARMEYALPDSMKGQEVGVVLQVFNETTKQWERGTSVYLTR